jgi:hypothetical protein
MKWWDEHLWHPSAGTMDHLCRLTYHCTNMSHVVLTGLALCARTTNFSFFFFDSGPISHLLEFSFTRMQNL